MRRRKTAQPRESTDAFLWKSGAAPMLSPLSPSTEGFHLKPHQENGLTTVGRGKDCRSFIKGGCRGAPWASAASTLRAKPTFEICRLVPLLLCHHLHGLRIFAINHVHLDRAEVCQEKHGVNALTTAFNILQNLKTLVRLEFTNILLQEKNVEAQVVVPFRLEMQNIKSGQDFIHFENIRLLSEWNKQRVDHQGSQHDINHEVDETQQLEDADGNEFALEPIGDSAVVFQDARFDVADELIREGGEAKVIAQVDAC